jgi:hypothetical protein
VTSSAGQERSGGGCSFSQLCLRGVALALIESFITTTTTTTTEKAIHHHI